MEYVTREQIYHILQNLSNVEASYIEYSRKHMNYAEYQTYFDFFDNQVLRSHNLSRFYFPTPLNRRERLPKAITAFEVISEKFMFLPGFDIGISKMFNFPEGSRHRCDYYTIIYLMEGSCELTIDEDKFRLSPGDFYLISPEVYYVAVSQPESICVYFDLRKAFLSAEYKSVFQDDVRLSDFFVESLNPESSVSYLAIHTDNSQIIRNRVLDVFAEYINQHKYCNNAMKNYLALLITSILRNPNTQVESDKSVSHAEQVYQLVLEYLKQHYQTASLTEIADTLHFSKQYICKIVKTVSGKTFQSTLMDIRLQMVQKYLKETALPLDRIAELCGFSTAAHLSRCFKNAFGMPPSAFRAKDPVSS